MEFLVHDFFTYAAGIGGIVFSALGYYIKSELQSFRSEYQINSAEIKSKQEIMKNNIDNHISNDEDFQERIIKSLDKIEYKLTK